MAQHQIAVIVGSLRKDSFNRKLANALARLAPTGLRTQAAAHRRPAALQPGRRRRPARADQAAEARNRRVAGRRVRDAGIQPLDPRRAQERDRPCLASLRPERVGRQARGRARHLGRRDRHRAARSSTCATCCAYLDMPTLGQPEAFLQAKDGLFEASGDIGAGSREFLQGWMDRYVAWVKQHTA